MANACVSCHAHGHMEPGTPQSLTDMLATLTAFHNRRVHVEHELRLSGEQLLAELTLAREIADQQHNLADDESIDKPLIEAVLARIPLLDAEHAEKRHAWRLVMMDLFETSEQIVSAAGELGQGPAQKLLDSTRSAYETQERAHDSAQHILEHMRRPDGCLEQLKALLKA